MRVYFIFISFLVCFLIGCSTTSKPVDMNMQSNKAEQKEMSMAAKEKLEAVKKPEPPKPTHEKKSYTPEPSSRSTPSYSRALANIGDDIILDSNGSFRVFIAYTKEAFEEKLLYIKANDTKGFHTLINSGNFFAVDSGTKAKVIDKLPGFASLGRRIRITHGEYSGITGWVGIENCKK